jgi:hypothetical protein
VLVCVALPSGSKIGMGACTVRPRSGPAQLHSREVAPFSRTLAITQTHWFRTRDGQVVEHWANRDDLGMATQLGWVPPTPAYLWRMTRAKRHARRQPFQ